MVIRLTRLMTAIARDVRRRGDFDRRGGGMHGGSAADAVCVADVHVRVGIFRRTAGATVAGKPDRRRTAGGACLQPRSRPIRTAGAGSPGRPVQ